MKAKEKERKTDGVKGKMHYWNKEKKKNRSRLTRKEKERKEEKGDYVRGHFS